MCQGISGILFLSSDGSLTTESNCVRFAHSTVPSAPLEFLPRSDSPTVHLASVKVIYDFHGWSPRLVVASSILGAFRKSAPVQTPSSTPTTIKCNKTQTSCLLFPIMPEKSKKRAKGKNLSYILYTQHGAMSTENVFQRDKLNVLHNFCNYSIPF